MPYRADTGGFVGEAHGWTGSDDRNLDPDPDDRDDLDEAEYEAEQADDWYQQRQEDE